MPLFADADWVQVVAALIFFVITGLAQFLQKRSRERQGLPPLPDPESMEMPPPSTVETPPVRRDASRPAPRVDWEDQLRQLLNGNPTPTSSPPPVLRPEPESAPTRWPADEAREETISWENSSRPSEEEISLEDAPASPPLKSEQEWNAATRLHTEDRMAEAASAYRQAANLSETTSARLRSVRDRTASHASARPSTKAPARSAAAARMTTMLRHPDSLRQVILAAAVLQPPKALQDAAKDR